MAFIALWLIDSYGVALTQKVYRETASRPSVTKDKHRTDSQCKRSKCQHISHPLTLFLNTLCGSVATLEEKHSC